MQRERERERDIEIEREGRRNGNSPNMPRAMPMSMWCPVAHGGGGQRVVAKTACKKKDNKK